MSTQKKLKIAMVGHKYVPSREGGVEIVVENLSAEMAEAGHAVTLFNRKRKNYEKISSWRGCAVEQVFTVDKRSLDAVVYAFFATLKVKKLAKKGAFDIVHYHAEGPCLFLGKFPPKGKRKYKIVVTIHGLDWQRNKWGGFASKVLKRGEKNAVKYADEIIVLTESAREYFLKEYGRETRVIPNGVKKAEPRGCELITEKYGLENKSYVLFLARIVPEKGLHYLTEAWSKLAEKYGKKLVIAGGSSHSEDYYNEVVEKVKGDSSVITTGFVEGQELEELYSNAFLYVLPSDLEGMPMSLLEALSYGLPCLVSDIPENVECAGGSAYTFKAGSVESLADELTKILAGDCGEKSIGALPDWSEIAKKTLQLYGCENENSDGE